MQGGQYNKRAKRTESFLCDSASLLAGFYFFIWFSLQSKLAKNGKIGQILS